MVSLAGLSALACGTPAPDDPARTRPNVLLYVVDTLRADTLGAYGNETVRTPHIDALARDGILFENAYANASWTRPSMASLLSGLYPTRHGASTRAARLPADVELLGERLGAAGWSTAFVTANPNVGSAFGFRRGFDKLIEMYARRGPGVVSERELVTPSRLVTKRALQWIDETQDPFFLVCLSIDPHQPLNPPARFDVYGQGDLDFAGIAREQRRQGGLTPELFRRVMALYMAEVSSTDASFGALLAGLEARGRLDDTLVVFTSDHGEEFGEYGRVGHGLSLADPVLRVPLILSWPGSPRLERGLRVRRAVELVDVVPTVLTLTGLRVSPALDGRVLLANASLPPRPVLSSLRLEGRDLRAAVAPPWKLVRDVARRRDVLFDLRRGEAEGIATPPTSERARLAGAMGRLRGARAITRVDTDRALPEATREALRALGYAD